MKTWWLKKIAGGIIIVFAMAAILSFIVMNLWNAIIPDLFNGPYITFWQSAGLLLLSHILLRGWGPWRYARGWKHNHWSKKLEEKLESLTPEEREKYKEMLRRRCGHFSQEHEDVKSL